MSLFSKSRSTYVAEGSIRVEKKKRGKERRSSRKHTVNKIARARKRINGNNREYHASEVRRRLEELSRGIAVAIDIRSSVVGRHASIDTAPLLSLLLRQEEEEVVERERQQ